MKYLVSLSGGKDSTACLLWSLDNLPKEDIIPYYIDTKWEHNEVYKYLDYLEDKLNIKIKRIESEGMLELCKRKKFMPNRIMRFCTENLKIIPAKKFYEELQNKNIDFINIVGIRREESKARENTQVFEIRDNIKNLYPIVDWTTQKVFNYIKAHGLEVNPLYKKGFKRVGCYPCIFATKHELLSMEDKYKQRLRNLEKEVSKILGREVKFFANDKDKHLRQKQLGLNVGCVNQFGICE